MSPRSLLEKSREAGGQGGMGEGGTGDVAANRGAQRHTVSPIVVRSSPGNARVHHPSTLPLLSAEGVSLVAGEAGVTDGEGLKERGGAGGRPAVSEAPETLFSHRTNGSHGERMSRQGERGVSRASWVEKDRRMEKGAGSNGSEWSGAGVAGGDPVSAAPPTHWMYTGVETKSMRPHVYGRVHETFPQARLRFPSASLH